ncbi:MAG: FxsB family radical SAM/SPASM domain protein [Chloroflexi bacterium]|nr:FxsB family radical SAM/SPASM domain protein [Chloroflexota bacterium]
MGTVDVDSRAKHKAHFVGALLKVASRCNLDCDYCYMYHHVDQTWRTLPKLMSFETIHRFATQLNLYVSKHTIDEFSIVFHGGEPMLFTVEGLRRACDIIRSEVVAECNIDFSIQTNGHLLTDKAIQVLENAHVGVSLSLDGPKHVNDLHRVDHSGGSSYRATYDALQKLIESRSNIFQGVLAVIDPCVPPAELLDFFSQFELPSLDFLMPDATHANPRFHNSSRNVLRSWLIEAYNLWYSEYSHLPIRFFDAVLSSRLGVQSPTDIMGFGTVNLIVIETDGSYTDHDVFKITKDGLNHLHGNVENTSLDSMAIHPKVLEHGRRLSVEGVANECLACPVLEACGGGAVMHRYHEERGLDAPTVYCREMFSLLSTASTLLRNDLDDTSNSYRSLSSDSFLLFNSEFVANCRNWRLKVEHRASALAQVMGLHCRENIPAAALWLKHSQSSVDNESAGFSAVHPKDYWRGTIRIQTDEGWLSKPFADSIRVISVDSAEYRHGLAMLPMAERYLSEFSPFLPNAIGALISDIIFVETTVEGESGIFSFSDDSAPNVLYISPYAGDQPLAPDDIADSILHEFLHQILYHVESATPLLHDHKFPRFPAPWRSGFRQSGGFLHGTFVFSGLALFWQAIAQSNGSNLPSYSGEKAAANAATFRDQATYGLRSAYNFSLLTAAGIKLVENIAQVLDLDSLEMQAPGILN